MLLNASPLPLVPRLPTPALEASLPHLLCIARVSLRIFARASARGAGGLAGEAQLRAGATRPSLTSGSTFEDILVLTGP